MGQDDQTPAWLGRVLDEQGPALLLYARQWSQSPEDIVQEALLKLIGQQPRPENVVAWLYRVVRNEAISSSRQQQRRTQREARRAAPVAWFQPAIGPLDAQEAADALAALPIELREVIVARIWGNLTFAEIAQLVKTSLSTAQRRFEQGLVEMKAILEKPCTMNDRPNPPS